jgi:glyoxylase-like metal-dependent hydrolase (beta-lactamase superfamily II)
LYDKKNKTVFLGDSLGYKFEHYLIFPPFMPPFWNKDGFYSAAEKLKQIDYEKIYLAHYGCLEGNKKVPNMGKVLTFPKWEYILSS